MKQDKELAWTEKSRQQVFNTAVTKIVEKICTSPEGKDGKFFVFDAPDWVIVIPEINDGKDFIMVKQWRHGASRVSIEFPGGVIDKGETPENAATRELLEETGYKVNDLVYLGSMSPNPAIMSNHVHFYLAKDLVNTNELHLDDDEFVDNLVMDKDEVIKNMGHEPFIHGLMCAALCMYMKRPQ